MVSKDKNGQTFFHLATKHFCLNWCERNLTLDECGILPNCSQWQSQYNTYNNNMYCGLSRTVVLRNYSGPIVEISGLSHWGFLRGVDCRRRARLLRCEEDFSAWGDGVPLDARLTGWKASVNCGGWGWCVCRCGAECWWAACSAERCGSRSTRRRGRTVVRSLFLLDVSVWLFFLMCCLSVNSVEWISRCKVASFIQISGDQPALLLDSWRNWWAWPAARVPVCWGPEKVRFARKTDIEGSMERYD
jgi:hypothetical protein